MRPLCARRVGRIVGAIALACGSLACGTGGGNESSPPKGAPAACSAGETASADGSCIEAGVPPDGCAAGFTHDDDGGCVATLPDQPCTAGRIALPGETACRPLAPCDKGKWGEAPVDATTEYVDASYTGGTSDGTAAKPWIHIQDAVNASPSGGVIAIAAGNYSEQVLVDGKPVRIWGACPDSVTISGVAAAPAAVAIVKGANGSEVHALAIISPTTGLAVQNATNATIDRVWIHDTGMPGLVLDDLGGAGTATATGSLIEACAGKGILVSGSTLDLEKSIVRGSRPDAGNANGTGVEAEIDASTGRRASLTVRGAIVEANYTAGIAGFGADVTIDDTLVRDNKAEPSTKKWGPGVLAQVDTASGAESTLAISASVFERNTQGGIMVTQSTGTVKATVVRDTQLRPLDQSFGGGMYVEANSVTSAPGTLDLSDSLIEGNHEGGVVALASSATVTRTRIAHTAPIADGRAGIGLACQVYDEQLSHTLTPASCAVHDSIIEDSENSGILVTGSKLVVDATAVRNTHPQASDGKFGDGLSALVYYATPCDVTVTGSRFENNARAGIAAFGASAHIGTTALECNQIQLDGERVTGTYDNMPFDTNYSFEDLSGNTCGCDKSTTPCAVLSSGLEPPLAI